jgi:hypothetical protein
MRASGLAARAPSIEAWRAGIEREASLMVTIRSPVGPSMNALSGTV